MRFEAAAALLRDQIKGQDVVPKAGVSAVHLPGLLDIVDRWVKDDADKRQAYLEIGHVLGVSSMLGGLTEK